MFVAVSHLDVVLPVKLDTESARVLYDRPCLRRYFRSDLEKELQIRITDEDIKKSITLYKRHPRRPEQGYEFKKQESRSCERQDIYTLVRAAMIMDRPS